MLDIFSQLWSVRSLEVMVVALIVLLMIQIRQHYKSFRREQTQNAEEKLSQQLRFPHEVPPPPDTPASDIVDDYISAFFGDASDH